MGDSIRKPDGRSQELERRGRIDKSPRPPTNMNGPGPAPHNLACINHESHVECFKLPNVNMRSRCHIAIVQ